MMISPEAYIEHFEDAEYLDLIKERDRLMQFITQYEEKDIGETGRCKRMRKSKKRNRITM